MIKKYIVERYVQRVAACLLLICIVVVFVAPAVDIAPTALRASRSAATTLLFLMLAATSVAAVLRQPEQAANFLVPAGKIPVGDPDELLLLNCCHLC